MHRDQEHLDIRWGRHPCAVRFRNNEPLELYFLNGDGDVFAGLELYDGLLLFRTRATRKFDEGKERARERYGDAAVIRRDVRFAKKVLERSGNRIRGKIRCLPNLDACVGPERQLAVGFKDGASSLLPELDDLDGRRADIKTKYACLLFLRAK